MDVVLSTRNPTKIEQIRAMFEDTEVRLHSLSDLGIEGEAVEDGQNIQENAFEKAIFAYNLLRGREMWTMADDTGLYINALGGEPGHRAARWAGDGATTVDTMIHTLSMLRGVTKRTAQFETCVVLMPPGGGRCTFWGKVSGWITATPRCEPQPGMPYSSIFIPDGESRVWAEMDVHYENSISHRGIAFRQVRQHLERQALSQAGR